MAAPVGVLKSHQFESVPQKIEFSGSQALGVSRVTIYSTADGQVQKIQDIALDKILIRTVSRNLQIISRVMKVDSSLPDEQSIEQTDAEGVPITSLGRQAQIEAVRGATHIEAEWEMNGENVQVIKNVVLTVIRQ